MKNIRFLLFLLAFSGAPAGVFSQATDESESLARAYQENLVKEFADSSTSPLETGDWARFSALPFYPVNPAFIFHDVMIVRAKKEKKFKMKTTTTRTPEYIKYGEVSFVIQGDTFKLNVYRNIELSKKKAFKNYLFLPFTDLTNGETTYGGGRYIDLEITPTGRVTLDFNRAYNPYCAYNHTYSCPVPPAENFLNIRVEAGVKEGVLYK